MDELPMRTPDPIPLSTPLSGETPQLPEQAQVAIMPGSMTSTRKNAPCATCGGSMTSAPAPTGCTACSQQPAPGTTSLGMPLAQDQFVYAIGRLSPQFLSLDVEKEFAQLAAQVGDREVSEHHRLKTVLQQDDSLYLSHHVCWVFTTQGLDSFAVVPRDSHDARQLIEAFVPASEENVINVVVGRPAAVPPTWAWSATGLRLVSADQILTFTLDEFIDALQDGNGDTDGEGNGNANSDHRVVMRELFFRLTKRADNHGFTDTHRACNYIALRYPAIYRTTVQEIDDRKALAGVDTRATVTNDRRLVSIRLIFRNHHTQVVEYYSCTVDVTGEFCFLVTPLSPTYG
ncbi:hypothetical protein [Streptomyces sp. R35]|uniref:PatG C-terminal domain-containing protein n=1 Tax=Streptomyces sp. R35 TaxID=3238630 RepID=A0AB39S3I1_9ACTN